MKKEYIAPEIELSVFNTEDIITASGLTPVPGGDLTGGDDYNDLFN